MQTRLKELRKTQNLTQKQLAKIVQTSDKNIWAYENGTEPPLATLIALCDFFGCSVDYLLGREDDFGNVATPGAELPADEQELLTNFRALPREEKVQARSYVRYLAERRAPGNKHA